VNKHFFYPFLALDPALPLFGERTDDERIDPSDAGFVNVIHSSMGTLLDGGLAFTEPRGRKFLFLLLNLNLLFFFLIIIK
jgi:hypothetical protein